MSQKNDLQFLNDGGHLGVVRHLSFFVAAVSDVVDSKAPPVSTEHPGNVIASAHLAFEIPFDFEHAPVCLDRNRCQSLLLPVLFRFSAQARTHRNKSRCLSSSLAYLKRSGPPSPSLYLLSVPPRGSPAGIVGLHRWQGGRPNLKVNSTYMSRE